MWHVQVRREPKDQPRSRQEDKKVHVTRRGVRFFAVLGSESSQLTSRRAAQGHVKWPGARRETERDGGRNLQEKFKGACDVWTANVLPEVVAWSV